MSAPWGPQMKDQLQGFNYLHQLDSLLTDLHEAGTVRDRAGNRHLFYDQYALLLLLYFFNPTITSLRGLQRTTDLSKVQQLGIHRTALGSLSEAQQVFDAALLEQVIASLASRVPAPTPRAGPEALLPLVAVDGSLLPALPRMAWALWQDDRHRAAKLHVAFGVFKANPLAVRVTAGTGSERTELRHFVQPGGFYVFDRGYTDYRLFQDLHDHACSFVGRVQENVAYEVCRERPLADTDRAAGVIRDVELRRLGTPHHTRRLPQPFRLVWVSTGHRRVDGTVEPLILVTNRLDLDAELIAVAYRYRWTVELFFRWLKCVLGCRHLLSQTANGVTFQVYAAVIASLLLSLWIGHAPTKATYEMVCHYFSGWATEEELIAYLERTRQRATLSKK
ncbi:transposase IS4 family protein [Methylocaldum marinum]|uniref:Transposase IS4 family protein n=1 Tax=Methylocaldum marinum TaxID=1432792 RepID=A0A250KT68_9GAMM|nr:IS4 family transposase [Methylocaldum marinum]BBA34883.1 transposase IS4 family protein [Methylocaldum marinum]